MADWNSRQYLLFKNERTQPAIDLANRIDADAPKKIIDIGCGPGNSTQVLARRFPQAYILGVDHSTDMVEAARKEYPQLDFKLCDAGKELPLIAKDFDVVFSNACIQWIPNHSELLKNMLALLRPGGVLAVQTPMNYQEPIHKIIGELVMSEEWKSEFANPRIFFNLTQSEYFDLLSEISSEFTMWETIYCHKLTSHEDIMEWYRGTGLRPYLNVLPAEKKKAFEQAVLDKVIKEYPLQKNGNVIFRFPRFFFTARN